MSIGSISAADLSQAVLSSSGASQEEQTLQSLETSLAIGNLNAASNLFQNLQNLFQNAGSAGGDNAANGTQLSTDLNALGAALSSGDLTTAQSAFATVQNDLKTSPSPTQANEINAATQSEQLVQELLAPLNNTDSSSSDNTSALLSQVYGGSSGLNVFA
jgi:hypothetical protein